MWEGYMEIGEYMLSDDILNFWVIFQKVLPNHHKDVKSNTEIGDGWILKS